jgi:hypothetical protein
MTNRGFFGRRIRGDSGEGETRFYSREEIHAKMEDPVEEEPVEEQRGFTVERAARIIDDLPPDVSRESALRIVRGTLEAAGIELSDLERQSRARETKFNSVIGLARERREDLQRRTAEVLASLEADLRKAEEARDTGVSEEEERIARARKGLGEIRRVRAFFGFPEVETEEPREVAGDETQILEGPLDLSPDAAGGSDADTEESDNLLDAEQTQVLRRRPASGPLSDDYDGGGGAGRIGNR